MTSYTGNPKEPTKKLLDLINEFIKVAGHKSNIKKSVVFLYIFNEHSKKEFKKAIISQQHQKEQNTHK